MKTEQMRVKLAEWSGWRQISCGAREGMWRYSGPEGTLLLADQSSPPDFCSDLNAVAQLEAKLTDVQQRVYVGHIHELTQCYNQINAITIKFIIATAKAPQRCEALVKTLGLEE